MLCSCTPFFPFISFYFDKSERNSSLSGVRRTQTDQVDMMEGDDGPARPDKSDGMHKPSHKVEGLGIMACWELFKRGVRGASSHPSPTCPPST